MLRPPVRRWAAAERDARIASAPAFLYPSPSKDELAQFVLGYVEITQDPVRSRYKRNLVATCYRVHGGDFLPLVEERFRSTGTAMNLLGDIRCLSPRETAPIVDTRLPDPPHPTLTPTVIRKFSRDSRGNKDKRSSESMVFRETGSAFDLLGIVRDMAPREDGETVAGSPIPSPRQTSDMVAVPGSMPVVEATESAEIEKKAALGRGLDCGCEVARLFPDLIYCADHRPGFDQREARRHDCHPSNPEARRFFSDEPAALSGALQPDGTRLE